MKIESLIEILVGQLPGVRLKCPLGRGQIAVMRQQAHSLPAETSINFLIICFTAQEINRICAYRTCLCMLMTLGQKDLNDRRRMLSQRGTSRFSSVTILCPDGVTGGPEALHQLCYELNNLGIDAGLVYREQKYNFTLTTRYVSASVPESNSAMEAYSAYAPRIIGHRQFDSKSLLILPEVYLELAYRFGQATSVPVACWILGVPNAEAAPTMKDEARKAEFLGRVIPFYQSFYARRFLELNGGRTSIPIFDYIDRRFVLSEERIMDRTGRIPRSIAYFPRKGGDVAAKFFEIAAQLIPDLKPIPIHRMSRDQVINALSKAQFYIDFGTQPGKDRVPREAAALGAAVLLREAGAASFYEDHPLERDYLFSATEAMNGSLARRVAAMINDPMPHLEKQQYYRQKIRLEKEEFLLQLRQFFLIE
ncbi:MAG: hypothetical protein LW713_02185 [Acetobacteraceae bacterium]|nr:hypothetical protein [Acetobacteraceae bacterium]